ncbi:DUF4082 domain-containing protein [Microbacterium memoriense]|uniref:DUF4082 domain-containing protein n=1 Tax=Microbacterium memoriense TaxID=2978350 RepID=A0ABT2PDY1_9MICO|nr:DUF4082 domain-containing protein [Microbacterium memoriense]MCT9002634.1 DUF4082 domain-containing protein [Microbacterium memoriense]
MPLAPSHPSLRRIAVGAIAAAAIAGLLTTTPFLAQPSASAASGFSQTTKPRVAVDPDRESVELGVRFSVKRSGTIVGIEYYDTRANRGPHIGSLWGPNGSKLATVRLPEAKKSGWVTATFSSPVRVTAGATYVASYTAPHGGYAADERYFDKTVTRGDIVFPRGAGVYAYATGGFPTSNYRNSNYYVDVRFRADAVASPSPTATATPRPTATPTRTATPTPSAIPSPPPSATPTPTPTTTPQPTTPPAPPSTGAGALGLPQEAWYGGSRYYAKFPKAAASGWTSDSFFPISVFLGKPEHAAALRAAGVNTYMGAEHDGSKISTVTAQGISVLAQQDEWTAAEVGTDPRVVGWLVSDECEMGLGGCTADSEAGRLAQQKAWVDELRGRRDGRFLHANFGNGVLGTYWSPNTMDDHLTLLDVSSVDKYAYTSPHVQGLFGANPNWPSGKNPATASAYGWLQDRMETYSTTTPNWVFVETGMPYLTESGATTITGDQIEGAVWNALIHGAGGIAYFQHNNNGTCGNYSILECGAARREKITAVNAQVTALAPALNSPSYVWTFGVGLDTALKLTGTQAYIIAMTDGGTGTRTFTLPPALASASSVEVLDEARKLAVSGGAFTDSFTTEHTHHIYRVTLP